MLYTLSSGAALTKSGTNSNRHWRHTLKSSPCAVRGEYLISPPSPIARNALSHQTLRGWYSHAVPLPVLRVRH